MGCSPASLKNAHADEARFAAWRDRVFGTAQPEGDYFAVQLNIQWMPKRSVSVPQ